MRRIIHVHFVENGRPQRFKIREMSALNLESWLLRAGKLLGAEKDGKDPFAAARILFEEGPLRLYLADAAKDGLLMEEMLACCFAVEEDGRETQLSRKTADAFLKDVTTLINLRQEALLLNLHFYPAGVREPLELPREWAFRKALEAKTFARPVNVPGISGSVISQGMASLHDMQENYSFPEALDMLELLNIHNYNQWAAQETAKHGR